MDETRRLIEAGASPRPAPARAPDPLRRMGTRDLVTEVARKASALARKEIELAKAELRTDLGSEVKMASGLGAAALCGIWGVELLLVAIVLGLMEAGVLPGWAAALVVAAAIFAIGAGVGLWGWSRRVRKPLDTTRRSLGENVRWAKERIA
ncbi:MAG TPA: phage holin family protein [Anaeromyxobacter sp.]|nr:phage holin family protein [Anaeromyxobacter sp.]